MDDPNRRRRQNEPPVHPTSHPRYSLQDPSQHRRSLAGAGNDRYRPAPINTPTSTSRGGMGGSSGSYGTYYQEAAGSYPAQNMPNTGMAYGPEYGQDSRQQTQSFPGYNTMMYNVAQPGAQTPVYDTHQFGSRQPATMQMMAPDVTTTYFGSEGNTGAHTLQQTSQAAGASVGVYQQTPALTYASSMSNTNTIQQTPGSADVSMTEEQQPTFPAEPGALEEKWSGFQHQLGIICQEIDNGSLNSAAETLLSISAWLLSQVHDLGLHLDNAVLFPERLKLWHKFNYSWLALGEKQREMMESGQALSRSQSLLPKAMIKKLGNELVRLCDGIERHGLIDYQYGVWEEQITNILETCLDLYEAAEENSGGSGSR